MFRWLGMNHMLVLGAYWRQAKGQGEKARHFWKRNHAQGKRQLEGNRARAHARKVTTGRKNKMHAWEEDLMTIGLGFW